MSELALAVQPHHKGFPAATVGRPVAALRGLGLAELGTPVLLLHESALEANLRALQEFCDQAGLSLAPHVKTTMSPEIIARQRAHGAWAATVATPTQLRAVRAMGPGRILLANQLVDPAAAGWLGEQLDQDPEFEAYCYVDSPEGVELLAGALSGRGQRRPLPVLVELGVPGGRSGARTVEEVAALANQVAGAPPLRFAGVGGFEGIIDVGGYPDRLADITAYLHRLREAADRTAGGTDSELIVTVGGSAYIELVRDAFDQRWRAGRPLRVVLRSGCYATHDSGGYQRLRSVVSQRHELLELVPALELWGRVLSRPEPGLALADFGKRDTGTDAGFPVPRFRLRRDHDTVEPAPPIDVVALNDQHAYLRGDDLDLAVGDLVGFGISHPCTTLDKWRLIPMVDADRRLVGAAQTWF